MIQEILFSKLNKNEIKDFLDYFKKSVKDLFPQYSHNSFLYTVDVDYGPEWLTSKILSNGKIVYLAKKENNIIGYLLTTKSIAGVSYADWLAVDKKFQKKGVASNLISMWENDTLNAGGHALYLWTTSNNNIKFYENRGFIFSGKFPKAWHGHDVYLMYKIIREPKEENYLRDYLGKKSKS